MLDVMEQREDPLRRLLRFGGSAHVSRPRGNDSAGVTAAASWYQSRTMLLVGAVLLFALFVRFYALADKPLHHDESLFAYYSFYLAQGYGYTYQPILHGPILEHVTALMFLLFGDSDFTMRLPAAIGSLGLFWALLGWRRYLGRNGALVALVLLAFSPSLSYYSRFLRNDAPYLAATFWCAWAVLRAFDTGERRYFWHAGMAATVMFCMMESSIFFFAACVGFLAVAVFTDWVCFRRRGAASPREFPGHAVFFTPGLSVRSDSPLKRDLLSLGVSFLIGLVLALAAAYFYVRVFSDSLPMPGWKRIDSTWHPRMAARILEVYPLAVALMVPLALLAGVNWNSPRGQRGTLYYVLRVCWHRRWTLLAILAVAIIVFMTLFTTYFTHTTGPDFFGRQVRWTPLQIYKNTWDYWWDQHQQHRIKGPFHYHISIILLYELPAVALLFWGAWRSLAGRRWLHVLMLALPQIGLLVYGLCGGFSGWDWDKIDRHWHISHPFHIALALFYAELLLYFCGVLIARRRYVESFLAFWTVSSLFAYSYAGEKVPWLSIHITGPAILLAGLYLGRWLDQRQPRPLPRWLLVLGTIALLWQLRSVAFVAWINPASPAERIVYNHTSPDVVSAVRRIDELAHDSQLGPSIPMYVKGEMEWPLYWYLRHYSNWGPNVQDDLEVTSRPIVIVNWEAVADTPRLATQYEIVRLKVREWWEPPLLHFAALSDIWRLLTPRESRRDTVNGTLLQASLDEWRKLWRYLVYREIWLDPAMPAYSNGANEFALCVSRSFLEKIHSYTWLAVQPMRRDVPTSGR